MSEKDQQKIDASRNLKLFLYIKVFSKRAYLPVIAAYDVNVIGMSVAELGLLATFVAVVKFIVEVPSGYFSDKVSRSLSYVIAGFFGVVGVLFMTLVQTKTGIYIGIFFETICYAFISGTGQALTHDSLVVLGREDDYIKYSSRVQSVSLIINAVILILVSLTYAIDPRLPFLLGGLQYFLMFILGFIFKDVAHKKAHDIIKPIDFGWLRSNRKFFLLAIVLGSVSALYSSSANFRNISLENLGISPEFLGIVFSIASVVGAVVGYFIYRLKALSLKQYASLDVLIVTIVLGAFYFNSLPLGVAAFIISMSFWRYRPIIYQDFILNKYKTDYKATLLSIVVNAEQLNMVWQPAVIGLLVASYGLNTSFLLVAVFASVVAVPFVLTINRTLAK